MAGRPSHVSRYGADCGTDRLDGPDIVHTVEVPDGETVRVTLEPESGVDLTLVVLESCEGGARCVGWSDERADGGAEEAMIDGPGIYVVVVDGGAVAGGGILGPRRVGIGR
jgi:hypothetical protein